ncbi:MAG: hypothetical protein KatS3mg130_1635 [Candidatus Sumerlaea sp.]|nr:MAG: hypothetical protein KatS3mg130_1635 [Candidatus Sumerlaea sp.]
MRFLRWYTGASVKHEFPSTDRESGAFTAEVFCIYHKTRV